MKLKRLLFRRQLVEMYDWPWLLAYGYVVNIISKTTSVIREINQWCTQCRCSKQPGLYQSIQPGNGIFNYGNCGLCGHTSQRRWRRLAKQSQRIFTLQLENCSHVHCTLYTVHCVWTWTSNEIYLTITNSAVSCYSNVNSNL